jgi:hypothetical protein
MVVKIMSLPHTAGVNHDQKGRALPNPPHWWGIWQSASK